MRRPWSAAIPTPSHPAPRPPLRLCPASLSPASPRRVSRACLTPTCLPPYAGVKSLGSSAEDKATHLKDNSARFATVFETFRGHYAKDGPFFTGSQFTFADAAVFQIIHDEIKTNGFVVDEAHYPRLKAFYAAVQARPPIAADLAAPRRHE